MCEIAEFRFKSNVPEAAHQWLSGGINQFEKDFGRRQERTYDCTAAVTLRVRIWLPLHDAGRFRQSVREWHNVIFQGQLTS